MFPIKGFSYKHLFLLFFVLCSTITVLNFKPPQVDAAYDGGRIIDNQVFLDAKSMNASEIQNFLASKGGQIASKSFVLDCNAAGSQAKQAYTSLGAPCGQSVPASSIIYYAAQVYGLNPRVILTTLQKEQSLITAVNPTSRQYSQAMGYACPTSGNCEDSSNFFWQIDNGTWVLRFHMERARGNNNWWYSSTSWTCGTEKNFYKPNLYPNQNVNFYDENGVMYRTHFISNASTSSMYCYTPHAYNNPQGLYGRAPYGSTGLYYSGSYNFVYYFELWFGSTQTADYSWQVNEQSIYADQARTKPVDWGTLNPSSTYFVKVRAKNTGNQPWSNSGAHPVLLGTKSDINSPLCDTSWLSCNRAATTKEATVAPGEIGTFEFSVKTPGNHSTILQHFNLVSQSLTWFNDIGMFLPFTTTKPTYEWGYGGQGFYTDSSRSIAVSSEVLAPNTTYYVRTSIINTGNTTWKNNGSNPIVLGTSSPTDRISAFCDTSWLSCNRAATTKEATVAPGEIGTFEFSVKTPGNTIDRDEYFRPVVEGIQWMKDIGLHWRMSVKPPTHQWAYVSQTAYTDASKSVSANLNTIANGSSTYLVVRAKNTGNTTWKNNGSNPIVLGTSSPTDRISAFCDTSWLSCNRAATTKEATVAPGEIGTFEFWVKAPYATNTSQLREYFRPVVEGVKWLQDYGMHYLFTMQTPNERNSYVSQEVFADSLRSQYLGGNLSSEAERNKTYYMRIRIKNTSGSTWTNESTKQIRLATSNPTDRISAFCDTSWLSCNRAATTKEATVAPGEIGTFEFSVKTPGNGSLTNQEYFRLVIDGSYWLENYGLHYQINFAS